MAGVAQKDCVMCQPLWQKLNVETGHLSCPRQLHCQLGFERSTVLQLDDAFLVMHHFL